MLIDIQIRPELNGRWGARVPAVPGLVVYGESQEESREAATKVAGIILQRGERRRAKILAFYPGRMPPMSVPQPPSLSPAA